MKAVLILLVASVGCAANPFYLSQPEAVVTNVTTNWMPAGVMELDANGRRQIEVARRMTNITHKGPIVDSRQFDLVPTRLPSRIESMRTPPRLLSEPPTPTSASNASPFSMVFRLLILEATNAGGPSWVVATNDFAYVATNPASFLSARWESIRVPFSTNVVTIRPLITTVTSAPVTFNVSNPPPAVTK